MSKSKNADMPAMPQMRCDSWGKYHHTGGLTKREMFAMAAMQGLCAHQGAWPDPKDLASDAVLMADALIAELERTK